MSHFSQKRLWFLHSDDDNTEGPDEVVILSDFLLPDSFCAVAPDPDVQNNPVGFMVSPQIFLKSAPRIFLIFGMEPIISRNLYSRSIPEKSGSLIIH